MTPTASELDRFRAVQEILPLTSFRRRCPVWLFLIAVLTGVAPGDESRGDDPGAVHVVRMETGALGVAIADNAAYPPTHQAGYNGVAELRLGGRDASNLFVPQYAGLNLEHYFNGDDRTYGWDIFEPRRAPMTLSRLSKRGVELRQERTEHWPVRGRLIYEVNGESVDLTYRGVPLEPLADKHGYLGVFFASYIHAPDDMAIHFIGRSRPGRGDPTPRWIRHLPPSHGTAANHRPAGSAWDPSFDDGFKVTLASASSDYEYVYSFYYGRSGENVLVQMFDAPRAGGELRFAQSPSGGGRGNPAWDFVYYCTDPKVGREFRCRVRAVYKKFEGVDDIIRLYERWSGEKVRRPPA